MATPSTTPFPLTFDAAVDVSTTGYWWILDADRTINWSISDGFFGGTWVNPDDVVSYAEAAFGTFSYYADVSFEFVGYFYDPSEAASAASDINISLDMYFPYPGPQYALSFFPTFAEDIDYAGQSGDVQLNVNSPAASLPSYEPGSAGWFLLIHELGHALGLKDPGDFWSTDRPAIYETSLDLPDVDWLTVMSYGDGLDFTQVAFEPATPMLLDVIGLQYTYGINWATNAGDDVHTLTEFNYYYTIWDAAGTDAVSATGATTGWTIFLPNEVVSPLVGEKWGFAEPTNEADLPSPLTFVWLEGDIKNAFGSAFADTIFGNDLANNLKGNGGDDTLEGGGANDTLNGGGGGDMLRGGLGNDTFIIDNKLDQAIEIASQGIDSVQTSETFTLGTNIENGLVIGTLARNLTGNGLANTLAGNGAANVLSGAAGNDTLDGRSGVDRLVGGLGRDQMTGGADRDIFDFNAIAEAGNSSTTRDKITDFRHATDDIDVSTIDATTLLTGNNTFVWKGTGAFTKSPVGELRFKLFDNAGTANDYTIVYGDTDGDTANEFQIQLKGLVLLTSSDFIL